MAHIRNLDPSASPLDYFGAEWRTSSYSGSGGGECVEIAAQPHRIAVRDSKNPGAGAFTVAPTAFATFVAAAVEHRI